MSAALTTKMEPIKKAIAGHIEQRIRTWRQQHMNRSGDRLALDDCMGEDSIADLVDFVCDEYALDAVMYRSLCDCGEAGHAEGIEPVAWRVRALSRTNVDWRGTWTYSSGPNKPNVNSPNDCEFQGLYSADKLAAAVLAERERCAKICEEKATVYNNLVYNECAAVIRGQKP